MTPNQPFLASQRDVLLLLSRILLVILFVMFGWKKIVDFSGTIAFMGSEGAPAPIVSAAISVVMELFAGIAILVGFQTRPLALLLALYTIGTGIIGHHYWTMTGGEQINNMIHFYKNIAIAGGLLAPVQRAPADIRSIADKRTLGARMGRAREGRDSEGASFCDLNISHG